MRVLCYTTIEMKRPLPILLDMLYSLSLALWLGGAVVLWTSVVPVVGRFGGLTQAQSGAVVCEILRRFGGIVEMCGLALLGVQFLLRRRYQRVRAFYVGDGVRQLLTFGAFFLAEYVRYSLMPVLEAARTAQNGQNFARLTQLSGTLTMIEVFLLAGVVALTVWLQMPRPVPVASSAVATTPKAAK